MKKTAQQITAECLQAGLPVDRIFENGSGEVEAYFTESLTPEQSVIFEDIYYSRGHKDKRKREYPPLEDFVDAFYWMQKGDSAMMDAYIAKCDAVKAKHPKG